MSVDIAPTHLEVGVIHRASAHGNHPVLLQHQFVVCRVLALHPVDLFGTFRRLDHHGAEHMRNLGLRLELVLGGMLCVLDLGRDRGDSEGSGWRQGAEVGQGHAEQPQGRQERRGHL